MSHRAGKNWTESLHYTSLIIPLDIYVVICKHEEPTTHPKKKQNVAIVYASSMTKATTKKNRYTRSTVTAQSLYIESLHVHVYQFKYAHCIHCTPFPARNVHV